MKLLCVIVLIASIAYTIDAISSNHLGIIEGTTILPHWAPYLVALVINGSINARCGGSLITENYVLTAAQCLKYSQKVQVILGADVITDASENTRVSFDVTKDSYIIHEKFDEGTLENDIALIQLPSLAITQNDYIKTIPVVKEGEMDLIGQEVVTLGWGTVTGIEPFVYSDVPMAVWINVTKNQGSECSDLYGDKIKDTNICCTHTNSWDGPSLNLCNGDFGGPLVINYEKLVGIASFSSIPCTMAWPNVFTDLSKYTSWLLDNSDIKFD
ncbi:unnamed protein product [Psylliodes chrysocephalus]|uniref:Peptidase S1 domain-containing protein n=1 Tax=Psylliodes chrysocephalus TaxID=3402493 RepID=A0A9P0GDA1_9CUCU|nr:unnamed protein product [Psylliodes chrysocephala]